MSRSTTGRRTTWLWIVFMCAGSAFASDWPMYRADARRSGYTSDRLAPQLNLLWVQQATAPPAPAWPSTSRINYDLVNQPIIVNGLCLIGSSANDTIQAIDMATGERKWRFFAGGPIRFAPAAWRDRLFIVSDDGCLYCLHTADGRLIWKHQGVRESRKCMGNGRMISRWPARGGPVVFGGAVYYSAGIWPSDGVTLCALSCEEGKVLWRNDKSGKLLMPQPHPGAEALSGISPQGYLLATDTQLFVPNGRSVPAAFDRTSGALQYYLLQENGSMGGTRVMATPRFLVNGGCFLDQVDGKLNARAGRGVFTVLPDGVARISGESLTVYQWAELDAVDRKGKAITYRGLKKRANVRLGLPVDEERAEQVARELPAISGLYETTIRFRASAPEVAKQTSLERTLSQSRPAVEALGGRAADFSPTTMQREFELIAAGPTVVCGSAGRVTAVDLESKRRVWSHLVDGTALGLASAEGHLLVSTTTGTLYCFGPEESRSEQTPKTHPSADAGPSGDSPASDDSRSNSDATVSDGAKNGSGRNESTVTPQGSKKEPWNAGRIADEILRASGVTRGICIDLGCGDGQLARELAMRSNLHIIGISADGRQIEQARNMLARYKLYGTRVTLHVGDPSHSPYPRNVANLVISSTQLRGVSGRNDTEESQRLVRPYGGVVCSGRPGTINIRRRGDLPGAGQWTHQNGGAANTLCSDDARVRGPLETAWYRDGVLEIPDRHAQGPAPLFSRGYLVVEGVHGICCLDAYNGSSLWTYPLPNLLSDWDGVHHDVGVGDTGSNFCLSAEAAFVRTGNHCLKIDLATGKKLAEFQTPVDVAAKDRNWGYVAYADGILFGTVLNDAHRVSPRYADIRLRNESNLLFALDAESGDLLWKYEPLQSVRNNAIAIAGGRVYLIDRVISLADRIDSPEPDGKHRPLLEPGKHPGGQLLALNARTGSEEWRNGENIFGTQLAVSRRHRTLLMYFQAVKHKFFRLPTEVGGRMAAFDTQTGIRRWDQDAEYRTRPIINDNVIYSEGGAWDLMDGKDVPWQFQRSYGCGQIAAGKHLMVFRSATLGYLDLTRDEGTENFGGIRTSCWFNAIPAGGLVLVPDGSSKCACSYQMQAWLALQPAPADH